MAYGRAGGSEETEAGGDSITLFTDASETTPQTAKPATAVGAGPDMADLDQSLAGLFQKKTNAAFLKECTAGFYPAYSVKRRSLDRKRVVSGKSVSVRVNLGGRRNLKKKNKKVTTDKT